MTAIESPGAPPAPVGTGVLRLAVVIPTYGREQVLVDTIRQLFLQEPAADEILVIDQTTGHEAATAEFLDRQARLGTIRWIRHSPPNLPSARNRGLRETSCDVVLFLDDDVVPEPGLIGYHRRNYECDSVHAVAGRTIRLTACAPRTAGERLLPRFEYRCFDFTANCRRESVAALMGANHSVRRSTALAIGGYDENYIGRAFREETDLALRLHKLEKRIVFDPQAAVLHLSSPSGGCRISGFQRALREWMISFPGQYFAWKHLSGSALFWRELAENFRCAVLSRRNVLAPYRLPAAAASFAFSLVYSGWRCHRCR